MGEVIDVHIHFGAENGEGCYWSTKFENSLAFLMFQSITGTFFRKIDFELAKKRLFKVISKSKKIDKVVLLALDGFGKYQNGTLLLDKDKTNFYTPNQAIIRLKNEYRNTYGTDKILLGMSINPQNENWETEFDKYKNEAVLCKWLPSSQGIDPSDSRYTDFYQKLSKSGIPLLSHVGPEHAIPPLDENSTQYNNPDLLEFPLSKGVTVIAAHCALPYFVWENSHDYQSLLNLFNKAKENRWNLYADVSALCTIRRGAYIESIQQNIGKNLLYGSDYPISMEDFSYKSARPLFDHFRIVLKTLFTGNFLDKNYYLIEAMGFDDSVFNNWKQVLNQAAI